jgi:hypothetical protein
MLKQRRSDPEVEVRWVTTSYKTIFIVLCLLLLEFAALGFLRYQDVIKDLLAGWSYRRHVAGARKGSVTAQVSRLTKVDGDVSLKRALSREWFRAENSVVLQSQDVMQTGPAGSLEALFGDGTSLALGPDSLIVIEANATSGVEQSRLVVRLNLGTANMTTSDPPTGFIVNLIMAGANLSLGPRTSVAARTDPRADLHEVEVWRGEASFSNGAEVLQISESDRLVFRAEGAVRRQKVVPSPLPVTPVHDATVFLASASGPVTLAWSTVEGARAYHVRLAANRHLERPVVDSRTRSNEMKVSGLKPGVYHWLVQAIDETGTESIGGTTGRFSVFVRAPGTELPLELQDLVSVGRAVVVSGTTEPQARLMINGVEVLVAADGRFRYTTPALPKGEHIITITAQNASGAVTTRKATVLVR